MTIYKSRPTQKRAREVWDAFTKRNNGVEPTSIWFGWDASCAETWTWFAEVPYVTSLGWTIEVTL